MGTSPKFFLTVRIDTLAMGKFLEKRLWDSNDQRQTTQTELQYHTLGGYFLSKITLIGLTKLGVMTASQADAG
jgi:hypothetical protein